VLLHPETGDNLTDHSAHAAWFGAVAAAPPRRVQEKVGRRSPAILAAGILLYSYAGSVLAASVSG